MAWPWGDKKKKESESLSEENLRAMKQKMKQGTAGDVGSASNIDAIKKRKKALEDAAKD